jgi:hypothetical protein
VAQTCQHCGASTDDDNRVMCPSCGRRMTPAGAAAPPATPPPPPAAAPPPSAYVGGQPAYAPYATAESAWPTQVGPPGVEVDYRREVIQRTSRLTVAFRVILAIPHLIALSALAYAVTVVAIVAWFAALIVARVPEGMYGFIAWVVRYSTRVMSYLWLLTDRWPSFSESAEDQVRVDLPGPQPLNRAAVLFRVILVIPAAILASLLGSGLAVAGFFIWLIVLIRGRVPQPVFDAGASVERYQTRFYAYLALLTARYPSGVYGDPGGPTDPSATTEAASPPVVNRGAKRLLVLFIVLGVLGVILQIGASAALGRSAANRQTADDRLAEAYQSMELSNASACLGAGDQLTCATEAARQNAGVLRTFKEDFDSIHFPSDTSHDVHSVRHAVEQFIADFDALSQAKSLQDYANAATGSNISADGHAFDQAVNQLSHDLEAPGGP